MNIAEILNMLIESAKEVVSSLKNQEFKPENSLKNLDANSVDRSEIIMLTQETLPTRMPVICFAKAGNIGELAVFFTKKYFRHSNGF